MSEKIGSHEYCGICKKEVAHEDKVCKHCGNPFTKIGKDMVHYIPTAEIKCKAINIVSMSTGSKDKDGNETSRQYLDEKTQYSIDYSGEAIKETAEAERLSRTDRKIRERAVIDRLLPIYNRVNSTHFTISNEIIMEDDNIDVLMEELDTNKKVGIQITVSDAKATGKLRHSLSLFRRGDAYRIFSNAIISAIEPKTGRKYSPADRQKTVLALDGWPAVRGKDLSKFKNQEKNFLKKAVYYQIWFVGITEDTIVQLY